MVNSTDFAKRLQIILDFYGLSATAFSDEIDFNRSTISHLISGRNKPSLEFVMKVVQKFPEVELYWLLNGKGVFPSESNVPPISNPIEIQEKNTDSPKKKEQQPHLVESIQKEKNPSAIERIVIFYKNGHFKTYEN